MGRPAGDFPSDGLTAKSGVKIIQKWLKKIISYRSNTFYILQCLLSSSVMATSCEFLKEKEWFKWMLWRFLKLLTDWKCRASKIFTDYVLYENRRMKDFLVIWWNIHHFHQMGRFEEYVSFIRYSFVFTIKENQHRHYLHHMVMLNLKALIQVNVYYSEHFNFECLNNRCVCVCVMTVYIC